MTFLLGFAHHHFAVLIEDTRFTLEDGTIRDRHTKPIIYEDQWLLGYTGLATLGATRTDAGQRLAEALANQSPSAQSMRTRFKNVAHRMDTLIAATPIPAYLDRGEVTRFAWGGVGWWRTAEGLRQV